MSLPAILMLADSAFPSGAFGHSFGLETAIQDDRAIDEVGVGGWISRYAMRTLATLDAAALVLLLRDRTDPVELDRTVAASIVAPEMRRANAHMTAGVLDAYAAMGLESGELRLYRAALAGGHAQGVHAVAVGLGFGAAGIAWRDACQAYASSAIAHLVSVAARAIPLGQRSSVHLLWALRPLVPAIVAIAEAASSVEDLCAQGIEAEIDAMEHAALDGRMFGS
jgi:urease accessory protein